MDYRYLTDEGYKIVVREDLVKEALGGRVIYKIDATNGGVLGAQVSPREKWASFGLLEGLDDRLADKTAIYLETVAQILLAVSNGQEVSHRPYISFETAVFPYTRRFIEQITPDNYAAFCNKLNYEVGYYEELENNLSVEINYQEALIAKMQEFFK